MRRFLIASLLFLPFVVHGQTPKPSPDPGIKALLLDSLLAFNTAARGKNFTKFYAERVSSQFQREFPLDGFTALFHEFIDKGYDIGNVALVEPVFEPPPAINADGLLTMQGYYPTRPNKLDFGLTYVYEANAWKIRSINIQVLPFAENPTVKSRPLSPPRNELKKLVSESILLLSDAIQQQDFHQFYNRTAKIWQKETSPEKLAEIFQSFADQKATFSSIGVLEPDFEERPAINDDGCLVIKGSYPTRPSRLSFDVSYITEDNSWKLVSININITPREEKPAKEEKPVKKKKKAKSEPTDDDDE